MSITRMLSGASISASGLAAERMRMEVVANNLANANSINSETGAAYRRHEVVLQSVFESDGRFGGVRVVGVQPDFQTPQDPVPGPDGEPVPGPNVKPVTEMVDMLTASRGYESNLRALRTFREMAEQALALLRGA